MTLQIQQTVVQHGMQPILQFVVGQRLLNCGKDCWWRQRRSEPREGSYGRILWSLYQPSQITQLTERRLLCLSFGNTSCNCGGEFNFEDKRQWRLWSGTVSQCPPVEPCLLSTCNYMRVALLRTNTRAQAGFTLQASRAASKCKSMGAALLSRLQACTGTQRVAPSV